MRSEVKDQDKASYEWADGHYDVALYRRLVSYFVRRGLSVEAEECVDTVFRRVRDQLSKGRQLEYPLAYARAVARHVVLETYKKRNRMVSFSDLSEQEMNLVANVRYEGSDPISRMEDEELKRMKESAFEEALSELEPADRELLLRYVGSKGDERKVLATKSGYTLNALRVKVHRLRQHLEGAVRRKLSGEPGEWLSG